MKTLLFLSFLTFVAGLARFMQEYGIVESYSRYGLNCERSRRMGQVNWWSACCTAVSAALSIPVCLEIGEGSTLQGVLLIAAISLLAVSFTPDFEKGPAYIVHNVAGCLCGALTVVLAVFVFRNWLALVLAIVTMGVIGLATRSIRTCYCLWLELAAYAYMFLTLMGRL